MTTVTLAFNHRRIACYYRPLLLVVVATVLFGVFWFTSRYPQLLVKADHVGGAIASMAYGGELIHVAADAALWEKILYGAVNWLDGMKIGMTFGVLLGALLHTTLRYYPLKIGKNLYLNSLKGALIGVPAAVCANCSVPVICGVTRGHGRVEVALGFLFSSPNFNPVVVVMTFVALPLSMSLIEIRDPAVRHHRTRPRIDRAAGTRRAALDSDHHGGRRGLRNASGPGDVGVYRVLLVGIEGNGQRLPEERLDVGQADTDTDAARQPGRRGPADAYTVAVVAVRGDALADLSAQRDLGVHAGAHRIGCHVRGVAQQSGRGGRIRHDVPDDAGDV